MISRVTIACTVGEIAVVQEQSRSDLVRINV